MRCAYSSPTPTSSAATSISCAPERRAIRPRLAGAQSDAATPAIYTTQIADTLPCRVCRRLTTALRNGRVSYQWRYDMQRFLTLTAATAALGLAGLAYAGGPEDQTGAVQRSPMPSSDPTTPYAAQTDPAATTQSSESTAQSARLAAIVPSGMSTQEAGAGLRNV